MPLNCFVIIYIVSDSTVLGVAGNTSNRWVPRALFLENGAGLEMCQVTNLWWYPLQPLSESNQPPSSLNLFLHSHYSCRFRTRSGASSSHSSKQSAMVASSTLVACTNRSTRYSPSTGTTTWLLSTWSVDAATRSTSARAITTSSHSHIPVCSINYFNSIINFEEHIVRLT